MKPTFDRRKFITTFGAGMLVTPSIPALFSGWKSGDSPSPDGGPWSMLWKDQGISATNIAAAIIVNGTRYPLISGRQSSGKGVETPLGKATETIREYAAAGMPVSVLVRIWQPEDNPALAAVQAEVTNTQGTTVLLNTVELLSGAEIDLGGDCAGARALVGLRYPQVLPLLAVPDITLQSDDVNAGEAATTGAGNPAKLPQLTATEARAKGVRMESTPIHTKGDGMVTLASPKGDAFTMSFITGRHHAPEITVVYDKPAGRVRMTANALFYGVELEPGQKMSTDLVAIYTASSPLAALDSLANLMLHCGDAPRKLLPPIGWCSWYAIRLPITHQFVIDNANVVADRFRALGMDLMLLDHGWQTDDICGDWDVDMEAFPKGLAGLNEELSKINLKMGLWVALGEVSGNSRLFKEHPEWMLRDENGKPKSTGTWYWKPNPIEYAIDATQPGAYNYIATTMRRLVNDGAVYFKNDFFGALTSPGLYPASRKLPRGWEVQTRFMAAMREGIGDSVYLRSCQSHPLVSLGKAEGVYQTMDTLDAGPGTWALLATQFKTSAGQYWLNSLYNHTACDLSIRVQGSTEECQVRTMMLFFSGSSIMFSDDLTILPEERLVLMQKCMPGLLVASRPVNLFTSLTPDIWHLHQDVSGTKYDLVALFNFEEQDRDLLISWKDLGLPAGEARLAREFWSGRFLGSVSDQMIVPMKAHTGQIISLWKPEVHPQFIGTDLHLTQGSAELNELNWDAATGRLSGTLRRAPGISGHVYAHLADDWTVKTSSGPISGSGPGAVALAVTFTDASVKWWLECEKT
jgi:hypothetical protein